MRQSQLFTKTRKEAPKDEVSKNAQLLIRAGFVHKEMAGVYSFLPLGLRVMNRISNIIREEMNLLGAQEVLLTVLQDKNIWVTAGKWDDKVVDNWFKTKLKNETEVGLGYSHEAELTNLLKDYVRSWRDLPLYIYQIQTKFRNESRAKSGIMRGREFLMKDMYSFSRTQEEHASFYEKAKAAYFNVYKRVGIGEQTYITSSSGGSFSKFSDEFQTVTDAGEDVIYVCEKCRQAINDEIFKEVSACPLCDNKDLMKKKAVEVGNIFNLGVNFSEPLDLSFADETSVKKSVIMGCYGIGIGRLMGTVVDVFADEKGIIWPKEIAPFDVHLTPIFDKEGKVKPAADALYADLVSKGISVLYDDRDIRPGEKFADSDLIGIPLRVIMSEKTMAENILEAIDRTTGEVKRVPVSDIERIIK
ncbi:MAG: putative prolyl-tRNA synthetase, prolyl-tRNA synthetase [Candidatus Taylorbacteria bacterium]|nr:putative prolyl-tRNA synthetase, prolyl-tRNA synthetase [Candidatus Taylorbacteria bacterium]